MPLPLIRLSISPVTGTAHHGVMLGTEPLTVCATHSTDLAPIGVNTAHSVCQSCTRAFLILTTPPHPGGEPDLRPAVGTGKGATAHRPIPGHLMGYCGKSLDLRPTSARRKRANCTALVAALDRFHRLAVEARVPADEVCPREEDVLWAPSGRGNLVTGHRRNSATGIALCGTLLSAPNPDATVECAPCLRPWKTELDRRATALTRMRARALGWHQRRELTTFQGRAADLNSGDAYTVSGCLDRHHVLTVTHPARGGRLTILAYVPADDEIVELGIHHNRLLAIDRPHVLEAGMPALP
ncbi:hypothetical protein OG824_27545 [Streptomyces prunicolor]|uniref:hypothetical protein n=1 Tax=Streptomyces prunicolor TaxID=67348 RepID=UPI00224E57B8|nr:hypothetical protein [Streptomyces prunicolor]MCX5238962.1 hypothetical protein [Streptomyces prunicolor]